MHYLWVGEVYPLILSGSIVYNRLIFKGLFMVSLKRYFFLWIFLQYLTSPSRWWPISRLSSVSQIDKTIPNSYNLFRRVKQLAPTAIRKVNLSLHVCIGLLHLAIAAEGSSLQQEATNNSSITIYTPIIINYLIDPLKPAL